MSQEQPLYHPGLRALSVAGAYCYRLAAGLQDVETRPWQTSFRGGFLIHCPTSTAWDGSFAELGVDPATCPKASIIGFAVLSECVAARDDQGEYFEHLIDSAILLPQPILGVKGGRGYWQPKTTEGIAAFNEAWQMLNEMLGEDAWL